MGLCGSQDRRCRHIGEAPGGKETRCNEIAKYGLPEGPAKWCRHHRIRGEDFPVQRLNNQSSTSGGFESAAGPKKRKSLVKRAMEKKEDEEHLSLIFIRDMVKRAIRAKTDTDPKARLKATFSEFDSDGNGTISPVEFAGFVALRLKEDGGTKQPSLDEISNAFKYIDGDGSGEIDYAEFEKYFGETERGGRPS